MEKDRATARQRGRQTERQRRGLESIIQRQTARDREGDKEGDRQRAREYHTRADRVKQTQTETSEQRDGLALLLSLIPSIGTTPIFPYLSILALFATMATNVPVFFRHCQLRSSVSPGTVERT